MPIQKYLRQNHTGIVVTHIDKASKYLIAGLAKNKTMDEINRVTFNLFEPIGSTSRQTMTFDNGREFYRIVFSKQAQKDIDELTPKQKQIASLLTDKGQN